MTPAGVIRLERFPTAVNGAVDAGGGLQWCLKRGQENMGTLGAEIALGSVAWLAELPMMLRCQT